MMSSLHESKAHMLHIKLSKNVDNNHDIEIELVILLAYFYFPTKKAAIVKLLLLPYRYSNNNSKLQPLILPLGSLGGREDAVK